MRKNIVIQKLATYFQEMKPLLSLITSKICTDLV